MKCPKCKKDDLAEKDFAWHKHTMNIIPHLRYKECKKCVSEINIAKRKEKKESDKMFAFI